MKSVSYSGYEFEYIGSLEKYIFKLSSNIARISKNNTWQALYLLRKTAYIIQNRLLKKRPCAFKIVKPLNFLL